MMSKAEFEKAYTAHRNRPIGERTICPDAHWTPAQEAHLRIRFASDYNLTLDTSIEPETLGGAEQETLGLDDNIYPHSFFDEAFLSSSEQTALDTYQSGTTSSNDLWTAPEQGATYMGPVNGSVGPYAMSPLAEQGYGFTGRWPFKGNPHVFMGSGCDINGCVSNEVVGVTGPPQPGMPGYVPDRCIDPRLLDSLQGSPDEVNATSASTSEDITTPASGSTSPASAPPAFSSTPASSSTPSPVIGSAGIATPSSAITSASSAPPAFASTPEYSATPSASTSAGNGSPSEGPAPAQRAPSKNRGSRSRASRPIEGVTRELRERLGLEKMWK